VFRNVLFAEFRESGRTFMEPSEQFIVKNFSPQWFSVEAPQCQMSVSAESNSNCPFEAAPSTSCLPKPLPPTSDIRSTRDEILGECSRDLGAHAMPKRLQPDFFASHCVHKKKTSLLFFSVWPIPGFGHDRP